MFHYIIIILFVDLCVPSLGFYLKEGATCIVFDDLEYVTSGICVDERRCFSALDTRSAELEPCLDVPKGKSVVCCSDCELVDDSSKAVISPTGGVFWQYGNKARDNCLQYLKDLPYKCRENLSWGVTRQFDEVKKCHTTYNWAEANATSNSEYNENNRTDFPHQALLGYGDTLETAEWLAGGALISDRFIVTAGHVGGSHGPGELKFVAVGVLNFSDPSTWQVHKVKRFIKNPNYDGFSQFNDIALIETETQIKFNENVLPACLPVEETNVTEAVATTWWDLKEEGRVFADSIQAIKAVEPFPDEVCNRIYSKDEPHFFGGFRHKTQLCFGSKKYPADSCRGLSGEPLLIENEFSSCLYTIYGVTSIGAIACGPSFELEPEVYTRVTYFVPWIESVVWPY